MENLKVINKMNIFDWGLIFIPPILAIVAAIVVERGQGGLFILPIMLISAIFYNGIFLTIAFCLAIFLNNKMVFRIVTAICAFPIVFFSVEYLLAFAMSFGGQPNANLP